MVLAIAGERSGAGKTTITLMLLAALRRQQQSVQSFKVGPDYIDPMFHQFVTGRPCRTLDPVLTSDAYVQRCFAHHMQGVDCGLVEGVMGLFDGAAGQDRGSTAHIARLLNIPVVLVIDCARLSGSVAAIAHGYRTFDPRLQLAGVVLNRVGSDRHLDMLKTALEPLNLPILGVLRRQDAIAIPDRHLGLIPTDELPHLRTVIDRMADLALHCFDWERWWPLLQVDQVGIDRPLYPSVHPGPPVRVAIAQDAAFNFYYPDNLELLTALGAELVPWSPLHDPQLPPGVHGLYLGGGFPEVFAAQLAANASARHSVNTAIQQGLPTYAECGGLMYLSQHIEDFEHCTWPMVGILPTTVHMANRLTLGYRQAIAQHDTTLLVQGETVWGHEFHRSAIDPAPTQPIYQLQTYEGGSAGAEGWRSLNVHASYVHLHWGDRPDIPQRFIHHCRRWQEAYQPSLHPTGS